MTPLAVNGIGRRSCRRNYSSPVEWTNVNVSSDIRDKRPRLYRIVCTIHRDNAPYKPRYILGVITRPRCHYPYHSIEGYHAERPRFSLSEKKMIIRHNFFTSTSASSSRACTHVSNRTKLDNVKVVYAPLLTARPALEDVRDSEHAPPPRPPASAPAHPDTP